MDRTNCMFSSCVAPALLNSSCAFTSANPQVGPFAGLKNGANRFKIFSIADKGPQVQVKTKKQL